jgi:hypothetical protein
MYIYIHAQTHTDMNKKHTNACTHAYSNVHDIRADTYLSCHSSHNLGRGHTHIYTNAHTYIRTYTCILKRIRHINRYVPIIPIVLVNGAEGIATGWSTSIPMYNPFDVIDRYVFMLLYVCVYVYMC